MTYDNTLKYLVEQFPEQFVRWLLGSEPILQEGEQEGREEGRQAQLKLVLRQLQRQLHGLSSALQSQVEALPLSQLTDLGEAPLDFSNEVELAEWLNRLEEAEIH